jgi:cyclopropane-fatty-acyl-phospholipid synthase
VVRSAIYTGTLIHARRTPAEHVFRYPVCFYAIDLDEIPELDRRLRLFGYNRPGLVTLRDSDHLGDPRQPLARNIRQHLEERGIPASDARITMLTNLRVAGYVFNPVTFFYVHGPDGGLRCVLAEVSNTFGERLPYLLGDEQRIAPLADEHAFRHEKRMHVSPFFPLDQDYVFRMGEPGDTLTIRMDVLQDGERPFWALLTGERHDMTDRQLARALARYPLMPLQVISLIHVEALRLWRKRVPFHRKPDFVPSEGSVAHADVPAGARTRGLRPVEPTGRTPLAPVVRALAMRGLRHPVGGWFEVEMPDGTVHRMGSPASGSRHARIRVHGKDFFRRIARRGRVGFGEAYQAGDWTTDDLPAFLEILALTAEDVRRRPPASLVPAAISRRPRLPNPADLIRARRDVRYHYDLGNDLYRVFLDPSMTYSCAYFEHDGQPLEAAQQAKYRRLCEKLRIGPDHHVLEVGCGWGGFAIHAARERGCRVTGITLSLEQAEEARRRVEQAGVADRVDIVIEDYREMQGTYDRIVSIEMIEAVGYDGLPTYFANLDRLLAPGGVIGIQAITVPDQRLERYRRGTDWIREYIFPGAFCPPLASMVDAMRTSSELQVEGVENIGIHYADTLRIWRENFMSRSDEVRDLGFTDEFIRTWEFYLAFCEAGFRTRALGDLQVVISRPYNGALPQWPEERLAI